MSFDLRRPEEHCDAAGQAVGVDVVRAQRDEDLIVVGVGGNRMRGGGGMLRGAGGDRRNVERRYLLNQVLVFRVDDAKDRGALGVGGRTDGVEWSQRTPGRRGVVVAVPRVEPEFGARGYPNDPVQ